LKDNPKMPLGKAMIEGGYKPSTATHPKQNFIDRKGTVVAADEWRDKLRGAGINEEFLKNKYVEWANATKIKGSMTEPDKIVPDYETQLKVLPDIRRDLGLPVDKGGTEVNVSVTNNNLNIPIQDIESFIKWRDEQRRAGLQSPTTSSTE
jgi:hypothetical protein